MSGVRSACLALLALALGPTAHGAAVPTDAPAQLPADALAQIPTDLLAQIQFDVALNASMLATSVALDVGKAVAREFLNATLAYMQGEM